jgi:hypothetical protein
MTVRKSYFGGQMLEVSGAGYESKGSFTQRGSIIDPSEPLLSLLRAAALTSDAHIVCAAIERCTNPVRESCYRRLACPGFGG